MDSIKRSLRPLARKYYGAATLTTNSKSRAKYRQKRRKKYQKKTKKMTKSLGIQTEIVMAFADYQGCADFSIPQQQRSTNLPENFLSNVVNPFYIIKEESNAKKIKIKEEPNQEEPIKSTDCDYDYCENKFAFVDLMIPDIEIKEEDQILINEPKEHYKCEKCCKQFTIPCDLEYHELMHHKKKIKLYECDECKAKFTDTHSLDFHKSNHEYECGICKSTYFSLWDLNYHFKFGHVGEKPFICSVCEKGFEKLNFVRSHQKVHIRKPFVCDECHKSFSNKAHLEKHQKLYTKPKQYNCNYCEKKFSNKNYYKKHVKFHTGRFLFISPEAFVNKFQFFLKQ